MDRQAGTTAETDAGTGAGARSLMVNAFDPSAPGELGAEDLRLISRRERVLGRPYRLFYREPIHPVRGSGAHLFDGAGNDYLDAYNNVPAVGHGNPRVQRAVAEQLGALNTHTRYLTDGVVDYAERLTAKFPEPLSQAIFTCTGSEAVDLALRIARHATGAQGVVVTRNAYHGTTAVAAEASPSLGAGNPIPDRVALIDAPDPVRGPGGEAAIARFVEQLRERIAAFERSGIGFAGLLVDSVLSSDGLMLEPAGFLARAAETAREHDGLYIADEVQPGFGRTGAWWGFERHGLVPDLAVLGKPMGNGIPIAGVVGSPALFDRFGSEVRYFNTFGGNPVSVAAASAVLDEIEERGLIVHAGRLGESLREGIAAVVAEDQRLGGERRVADVRGAGLFLAVEYVRGGSDEPDPATALEVVNELRRRRVLVSASGVHENVLKIRPPLVFDDRDAERFLDAFADVTRSIGA